MKSSVFWDITPYSSLKISRSFGRKYRLHFQSRCLLPASCWFLAWLVFRSWRSRWHVPPKYLLIFNGPHGIISQKIGLFITTPVRTLIEHKSHFLHKFSISTPGNRRKNIWLVDSLNESQEIRIHIFQFYWSREKVECIVLMFIDSRTMFHSVQHVTYFSRNSCAIK
jgi:hypothetical protein